MPPSAIRQFPGTCARCSKEVPRGARFTWGKGKGRIFHYPECPDGKAVEATEVATEVEAVEAEAEDTHSLDAIIRGIARDAAKGAASSVALDSIRAEVEALRTLVQAARPVTVEVRHVDTGDTVKIDGAHALLPRLINRAQGRHKVYLYGLPGSGKSTAAMQVATALKLRYGYISLNPQTPDSRLLGYMDLNPGDAENPIYRSTVFYECYTQGGVFCIDELDNASASLLTTLNGMIENGHGAFPCGMRQRHPDFILIATGNTNGRGGDVMFPERRAFDAAFLNRFCVIEWGYDEAMEEAATMARNTKASAWLAWVRGARAYCLKEKIRVFFTPRASFTGAELLLNPDNTVEMVADEVGFQGCAPDIRSRILKAVPLPNVSMSAVAA